MQTELYRKQMEADFLSKMIEIGKNELLFDSKKKVAAALTSSSGTTNEHTPAE